MKAIRWFLIGFVTAWIVFDPISFGTHLEKFGGKTAEFGKGFVDGSQ